jgi:hypothetical protein
MTSTLYSLSQDKIQLSGYIKDASTNENLQYAYVETDITGVGSISNEYGFYSFTIPANKNVLVTFSFVGSSPKNITINEPNNYVLNVSLESTASTTEEILVRGTKANASKQEARSNKMSAITLPTKNLKTIPSIGGEVDILKVVQLLPGVARGTEGGTGMFVRGGDADQNLVLLDEATVYNVGHLFGFFSVFNPDAIKDLTLTKGAFPANYGGRLSSVLDIRMNEGNSSGIHGSGGVGLLSSRLTLEGPLMNEKISFLISGRRTYIDKVLGLANVTVPYFFYDFNAKINYTHNHKNRFYLSSYVGDDVLRVSESVADDSSASSDIFGFGFNLKNITQTMRWNHLYSAKTFSNTSLIHTLFNYDIKGDFAGNNILIKSQIRDLGIKNDITHYYSSDLTIKYGGQVINHQFRPNIISTSGEISEFLASQKGELQNTLESAIYGNAEWKIDTNTTIAIGLRLSSSLVKNKTYLGPEPRIAAKRNIGKNGAIKASYSRMYQYMHRVSSSSVALPTDLWYPISERVKPQNADQIALGYHYYWPKTNMILTAEGYYKWMRNLIEYEEGTNLILNDNFEESLIQGNGTAYGFEFLAKRDEGDLNGWIGYTLSWSKRQFDELNGGKEFWARFDRRHDISVVANYAINKRHTISAVWVFSNGSRFTPIIGQYLVPNAALTGVEVIPLYTERNAISLNSSHRLDINWVIKNKKERRFKYEWHIGGYNVYNRATPFTTRIVPTENGGYKYEQPGLFGFIPSVAFNFNF